MDLSKLSKSELLAALRVIDEAEITAEKAKEQAQRDLWLKHQQVLLEMVPEHSRSSCSDADPCNEYEECSRCILLNIVEGNRWGATYWPEDVKVEIRVTKPRYDDNDYDD